MHEQPSRSAMRGALCAALSLCLCCAAHAVVQANHDALSAGGQRRAWAPVGGRRSVVELGRLRGGGEETRNKEEMSQLSR